MAMSEDELWENRIQKDVSHRRELSTLFKELRLQALGNIEYFQDCKGANNERFFATLLVLYEHVDKGVDPGVERLLQQAHRFDFDPTLPANGYRSIVAVIHKCCLKVLQLIRYIGTNRSSFLFRGAHYSKELESYVTTLGQLRAMLYYELKLIAYCDDGELFPSEEVLSEGEYQMAEQLMMEVEALSQETFYGRCLGFQYCDSMVGALTTINVVMASYSQAYSHSSAVMKLASSVLGSGKYFMDPDLRAQQIVSITREGDIKFCKAFWSLAEGQLMHNLPLFICPPVAVDRVITLEPVCFDLPTENGSEPARINPPCAHSGHSPVHTRLISFHVREGQEAWIPVDTSKKRTSAHHTVLPKSKALIIHVHGGGWVAQSSASHEVYLRHWAKDTGVPILSVDYSLAPEHPFPRQLEEVFYAYCWALKNRHLLGTTAEKICIVGDSAGGNIAVATAMRIGSYYVRRPDAVFSIYGCMLIKYTPGPSRMLALMDPLLPIGILSKCLAAYAGVADVGTIPIPGPEQVGVIKTMENGSGDSWEKSHGSSVDRSPNQEGIIMSDPTEKCPSGECQETKATETNVRECHQRHKPTPSADSGFHETSDGEVKTEERHCTVIENDVEGKPCANPNSVEATHPRGKNVQETIGDVSCEKNICAVRDPDTGSKVSKDHLLLDLKQEEHNQRRKNLRIRTQSTGLILTKSPSAPNFHRPVLSGGSLSSSLWSADLVERPITPTYAKVRHFAQSPIQHFRHVDISQNPYMSPYLASDELLQGLCPVYFMACALDPMLDDSIMFAKRLRDLGKGVHVDVATDLPHGFLNFVLVSRDAKLASDLCVRRMRQILALDREETTTLDPPVQNGTANDDEEWEILNQH